MKNIFSSGLFWYWTFNLVRFFWGHLELGIKPGQRPLTPPVCDPALSPLPPAWKVQVLNQMFPGGRRCSWFPVTSPRAGQSLLTSTESFRFNLTETNFHLGRKFSFNPSPSSFISASSSLTSPIFDAFSPSAGWGRVLPACRVVNLFFQSSYKNYKNVSKCLTSDAFWGISRLYFHCETIGFNLSVRPINGNIVGASAPPTGWLE